MNAISEDTDNNFSSPGREIGIIITVLDSGNSVELPATGYSMFPTFRPGDRVIVKPFARGEMPVKGSVVVYVGKGSTAQREESEKGRWEEKEIERLQNYMLLMHRLVEIKNNDSCNPLLITRGDSGMEPDKPWYLKQLLGTAISYKRGKKEHFVKTYIPEEWRYQFNRKRLWLSGKMKRIYWIFCSLERNK